MDAGPHATFLLLEDDIAVGAQLRRMIAHSATVVWVPTLFAGRLAAAAKRSVGLVFDVNLTDGSGLDLLRELRTTGVSAPALVITGSGDPRVANSCFALSAACVYKPEINDHVAAFVRRTLAASGAVQERTLHAIKDYGAEHGMTKRELDVLELATLGVARERLAAELGVSENTVKTLIRRLLGRCGESNLDDVVRSVLASMVEAAPTNARG